MGAGAGERMNSDIPKQFKEVNNLPIIIHTYNKFSEIKDLNIIIVLPSNNFDKWKNLIIPHVDRNTQLVKGGDKRNISVRKGLENLKHTDGLVAIHDGVRPFISNEFILKLFKEAEENGNAVPFTKTVNSLRQLKGNKNFSVDRTLFVQIETPQIFRVGDIIKSLNKFSDDKYTDEASLIEKIGIKINLVENKRGNIKITTEEDLNYFK